MSLFGAKKQHSVLLECEARLRTREAECLALQGRLEETQELVRHLDEDRELLLKALERLRPGDSAEALAQTLLDITFKPMGLACFFVALANWDEDLLQFVLYHEGGRARNHPSRRLSDRAGLSERVLSGGRPIYIRTMEEGRAAGSFLTAAELATGLIPHSWYGLPLGRVGRGPRPVGVMSFQSFQTDAFTEGRRRIMDALGALLSTCLEVPSQEP